MYKEPSWNGKTYRNMFMVWLLPSKSLQPNKRDKYTNILLSFYCSKRQRNIKICIGNLESDVIPSG